MRPLLHPTDRFPEPTVNPVDGDTIRLLDGLAGHDGAILLYGGAWCSYCHAQQRSFERAHDGLAELDVELVALSVDDEAATRDLIARHGLRFPCHGAVPAATGAFVDPDPPYLQSTGFVLDPDDRVVTDFDSSAAIGRLVPDDVVGLVRDIRDVRDHPIPERDRHTPPQTTHPQNGEHLA